MKICRFFNALIALLHTLTFSIQLNNNCCSRIFAHFILYRVTQIRNSSLFVLGLLQIYLHRYLHPYMYRRLRTKHVFTKYLQCDSILHTYIYSRYNHNGKNCFDLIHFRSEPPIYVSNQRCYYGNKRGITVCHQFIINNILTTKNCPEHTYRHYSVFSRHLLSCLPNDNYKRSFCYKNRPQF